MYQKFYLSLWSNSVIFLSSSLKQLHSTKSQNLYVVYNAIMNQVADILMLTYFHKMQLLKDQTV